MIGIKGIKMPKGCAECRNRCRDFDKLSFSKRVSEKYKNERLEHCPLVDLGSEDMSWEELVEKVKELNLKDSIFKDDCFLIPIVNDKWEFFEDGDIHDGGSFGLKTNQKPYQMWQIINALTGDNK